MADQSATIEPLLRDLAPQVLAIVARRTGGRFDTCEDAVQEALLEASLQWPNRGIPDHPRAWLVTVATRRLHDRWRSDSARRNREMATAANERVEPDFEPDSPANSDDTLVLLLLCCHPALSATSQIALTLRAVGGLTTAQIAAAYLVPEATMAQRISRAKQTIRKHGARFDLPPAEDVPRRLQAVMHVLYLVFNEGYVASAGQDADRPDLTREAIRLTRLLQTIRPEDGEATGLLALMLLTEARRLARVDDYGNLVPLTDQDRTRWNASLIAEGTTLLAGALQTSPLGPYQVQAAIAAIHSEAPNAAETDWPQIVALYAVLDRIAPSPIVTLNRAVAIGMAQGPEAGLAMLESLDPLALGGHAHRLAAVRGALLELTGDRPAALEAYRRAAELAASEPERRYLASKVASLHGYPAVPASQDST